MKLIAIGIWIALVALGSAYAAAVVVPGMSAAAKASAAAPALQFQKTKVINVPMIADGAVQGFITMQFGYTTDPVAGKDVHLPPEAFLIDEAFRTVYGDPAIDPTNLGRYDVTGLTKHLVGATNEHLGAPMVKEVLIEQFSYIPKDTVKK